ncbi:hypothetical protein [Stenotrophomonas muris]|uniref:hypothetical protein n=1 Tax=Stenotrophomonas muris TaxID=2963283 RepID=UPI0039C64851
MHVQTHSIRCPLVLYQQTEVRKDAADIAIAVRRYAQAIGCDASNTQAAIAWALRSSAHTLQAIRDGRRRAEQLRARQASAHA